MLRKRFNLQGQPSLQGIDMTDLSESYLPTNRLAPAAVQARFNRGIEPDLVGQEIAEDLAAAFTGLAVTAMLLLGCFASDLLLSQLGASGLAFLVSGALGVAAAVSFCLSLMQLLRPLRQAGRS
ncbi:MAG: hypothetical protein B7Z80_01120 [Rhodospirillales bacterium 20-64-7]|nr:MAG: hypothetical protein B7Z80_01120 [Rhodospirillales bacterium 20-64-7]